MITTLSLHILTSSNHLQDTIYLLTQIDKPVLSRAVKLFPLKLSHYNSLSIYIITPLSSVSVLGVTIMCTDRKRYVSCIKLKDKLYLAEKCESSTF